MVLNWITEVTPQNGHGVPERVRSCGRGRGSCRGECRSRGRGCGRAGCTETTVMAVVIAALAS